MNIHHPNIVMLLIVFFLHLSDSKAAIITGSVKENESFEAIPFVNISIEGTTQGTVSGIDGNFSLGIDSACTIIFSSIGYITLSKRANIESIDEVWDIRMQSDIVNLPELSVKPDYSYDRMLYKKVIAKKGDNNSDLTAIRSYGNYDRTTILLATDSTKRMHRILQESKEAFIHDAETDIDYIPVYISEELSDVNYTNNKKNINVLSNKKDGLFPNLNSQIENMILEKITIEFNFYKDQINLADRGFKSPLCNNALLYYNIYLSDSILSKDTKHYKFSFYPKNEHGTLFKGHLWVEDESFALISISATLAEKASVNFINALNIKVSYEKQPNGKWFYHNQKMRVNFSMGNNRSISIEDNQKSADINAGNFCINRTLEYVVPENESETAVTSLLKAPVLMNYDQIELEAINGIEILKENRVIKSVDRIGNMFLSGYYSKRNIDIGPVFDLYSSNYIEGHRFTLPIRSGKSLSEKFTFGGYLGYGTKSKKLKYGVSSSLYLPFKKRTIVSFTYNDDYFLTNDTKYTQFIQENPYSKGDGNLISAITSKNYNPFVFQQKKFELGFQTDISKNTGVLISPYYHKNFDSEYVPFTKAGVNYSKFDNYGVLLNVRFSFGQSYDDMYFSRIYYGNTYPIVNLSLDVGEYQLPRVADVMGESQHLDAKDNMGGFYTLANVSVKHRFNIGQAYVRYMINAGYMHGGVPYTLLEKPYGKNSLGYSRYSYNLLGYASFAHNLYTNIHINLNGGGIIFNHIPIISNLKLREIISLKCYYGRRTASFKEPFEIPDQFNNKMTKPYAEIGFGITNIFKVFRIEYVRLLDSGSAVDNYTSKHGIRMRFEACF
ncbi:MAG: carboxypeptidase-like regulatory domain-containing protein [Bacteroidales bacterium]|nr:carboxypeptidase-like regulatory domain-containing protein [Bacteroidales bacterium]